MVQLIAILLLTAVNVGVPSLAHAADITPLSPTYKGFSNNMGGMVYEARVVQASVSFDGTIGYGGNSPQIYLGVLASLNNKFVGTPEPWYNIHKLRISVTIRDSSQNVLNPQESTKYTIGYNMWDSPYSSATDQDYASEFQDLVKYFTDLELGLVIPYPIPDLSSVKLPQQFNGVAKDTSSIWAQWATYPDSLFQAQSFPYSDPYHSIKLLVQPNFPKPDVYSISVSVVGERGSCDIGLILGPTTKPYVCSADETLSSSYSFNYVYEADAGVDGDASNSLPKDGGTPRSILHGSYTGFFYGTDTADVYSFSASVGEKIVFTVTPPTSADFSLTIYDPSQNQIGTQDLGVGATNSVSFTASASSTYFAKISRVGGWGTYSFSLSDTFQLAANPVAVSLGLVGTGSSASSTVKVASPTDFSGQVDLTTSVTPSVPNGPTTSLSTGTYSAQATTSPNVVLETYTNPFQPWNAFYRDWHYGDFDSNNGGPGGQTAAVYGGYSVSLPAGASITKVEVQAWHYETTYGRFAGSTFIAVKYNGALSSYVYPPYRSSDTTDTLDVTSLVSGGWTASTVSSVGMFYATEGGYFVSHLDWLPLIVTYTYPTTSVKLTPGVSDSRTLTIYSSPSTPAGAYTVSVTGTGGGVSLATSVIASVTDFQVTASPVSMVILPGQTATMSITAYGLNGFTGAVSLTDSYSSGLFCSGLNPYTISLTSTVTSGTSTVSCNGPPGSYSLSVTGTSGSQSRTSATIMLNVSDFVLTANPSSLTFPTSSSANTTIDVAALYGFRGLMNLTYSTPPGLTCDPPLNIEPDPISMMCWGSPGTYTVTVTATSGAALGAAGGSLSHQITVPVTVQDFTISSSPTSVNVVAGVTWISSITVAPVNGFTGTVNLATAASPSGLTCSTSPATLSLGPSATSTLYCSGPVGSYTVTVRGTSGSLQHIVSITVVVRDFSISVTPSLVNIPDGRSGTVTIQAASINGYTGSISLGLNSPPYCSIYSFSKPTLQLSSGGSDTASLVLNMGANCYAMQYLPSVTGYDSVAGVVRYGSFTVNASDFSINAQIGTTVGIGGQYTLKYNVTYYDNNNYPGSILTQTSSFGANNCCLSTTIPTTFSITRPDSNSAPGIVTTANTLYQPFAYPWQGSGFYAQGRDWIFFIQYGSCSGTTTNCLYYATSTNGVSWTIYNIGVVTGSSPSIVTDGTHVFYVRYDGVDTQSGKAIKFDQGTLHTDGTIAWQPETVVKSASSGVYWYHLSMRASTTGQFFIAYQKATSSGGSGLPYVIHSNAQDYSTWQQETLLTSSSDDWRASLVPLPGGQMYILYWPYWGPLNGTLWSNNAWGIRERVTPSNTYVQQTAFGFSTGNSTVYAIWQERTSQKIQFAIRTSSWSAPQTIFTADTGTNPRWTAGYDSLHGKWYIIYYSYSANQIWEYSGQPGRWSGKTILYTTNGASSNTLIGSFYNTGQVNTTSNTLGIFWTQYDSSLSTLQLRYANATIFTGGSFPATWPISSTGAGSGATSLTITASDGYITRSLTIQLTINGYNVTYWYNPLTVTQGSSSAIWLQIFPEYGIPLTNATIVATSVPSCLTVYPPSPKYFNIGPIGGYDYPDVPIAAASSCALGNYQVNVTVSGVSNHAYDKLLTFTVTVQAPSGGGGSIADGTLITMADGRLVPVQNLKVGDQMLGYDPATGKYGISLVTSIKVVGTTNMLIIHTASGAPFRVDANPHQTLWVKTSGGEVGWLPVTLIRVGDYLWTQNGWTPVTSIEFAPAGNHVMYDIVATDYYFASGYLDPNYKV